MEKKKYFNEFKSKQVSCVLRLTESLHGSKRVICGDSWFASFGVAKALLMKGLFFTGPVKTSHKFFPKAYLTKNAFTTTAARGSSFCLHSTIDDRYRVTAEAWNEPAKADNTIIPPFCFYLRNQMIYSVCHDSYYIFFVLPKYLNFTAVFLIFLRYDVKKVRNIIEKSNFFFILFF